MLFKGTNNPMAQPPPTLSRDDFVIAIDHIIRERRTAKTLRDPQYCDLTGDFSAFNEAVRVCIDAAGWAPFHKIAHEQAHRQHGMPSPVPWRFYVLDKPACCTVVAHVRRQAEAHPDSNWSRAWGSKIPKLLAGAGACVLVTWLPDPPETDDRPELTENNIEHIAAASAATQNLLLAAEARGLYTYWSTGGIFKDGDMFDRLGIPRNQMLLGAIFLSPADGVYDAVEPGGLRDKRGAVSDWSTWVVLDGRL
jgi:nitroreductase